MTTHRERVQACINGEKMDRPPVALWRHFPVDDQSPEALSAAHLMFQEIYDFDILKVTPASSYSVKDWGVDDMWEGNSEGTRRYIKRVVTKPGDWDRLQVSDPSAPHLAGQLACLREIRHHLDPETPLLQTIFNPLAQAKHLAGDDTLLVHIRNYPEAVLKGLETITETTRRFIEAALSTGIDGIFYAVQHAQARLLTNEEFVRFCRSSDLNILGSAKDLWCNMLHLHGENIYFEAIRKYPVHIINWHDRESNPSLGEVQSSDGPVVCGGIRQDTLVYGDQKAVQLEASDAISQTGGKRFILSTGCVVPIIAPHGNIMCARESVVSKS